MGIARFGNALKARPLAGVVALGFLALLAIQMLGPLRLNEDSVVHLTMARQAAEGHGFHYPADDMWRFGNYPVLYACLVLCLNAVGWAPAWVLIGINLLAWLSFAWGCWRLTAYFTEAVSTRWQVVLASSMFFVHAEYLARATPDLLAGAVAVWSMVYAEAALRSGSIRRGCLALVLAGVAAGLHLANLFLLPAFVAAFCLARPKLRQRLSANRHWLLPFASVSVIAFVVLVLQSGYVREWVTHYSTHGWASSFLANLTSKGRELGQVLLNIPSAPLPRWMDGGLVPLLGLGVAVSTLCLLWRRSAQVPAIAWAFGLRAGVLFIWRGDDPRFWLPMLPVLYFAVMDVWQYLPNRWRSWCRWCHIAGFATMGLLFAAYFAWLALSRESLPQRYRQSKVIRAYAVHFADAEIPLTDLTQWEREALVALDRHPEIPLPGSLSAEP